MNTICSSHCAVGSMKNDKSDTEILLSVRFCSMLAYTRSKMIHDIDQYIIVTSNV